MKYFLLVCGLLMLNLNSARAADDLNAIYQGYAGDTQTALISPHRGIAELGGWLSNIVADALIFTPGHTADKLNAIRPYFSMQGYKAYTAFLTQMGFAPMIQAQTLSLTSIVNHTPLLIGQGVSVGRYAWAYEMPVVLSLVTPGKTEPVSHTVTLRVQIGRTNQAPAPNYVLIENWQEYKEPSPPPKDTSGKPE